MFKNEFPEKEDLWGEIDPEIAKKMITLGRSYRSKPCITATIVQNLEGFNDYGRNCKTEEMKEKGR